MKLSLRGSTKAVNKAKSMLSVLAGGSGYKLAAGSRIWRNLVSPTCKYPRRWWRSFCKKSCRLSNGFLAWATRTATVAWPAALATSCLIDVATAAASKSGSAITPIDIRLFVLLFTEPCSPLDSPLDSPCSLGSFAGPKCRTKALSMKEIPGRRKRQSIGIFSRGLPFLQTVAALVYVAGCGKGWVVNTLGGDESITLTNAKSMMRMKVRLQGPKQPSEFVIWPSPLLLSCQKASHAALPARNPNAAASKACWTAYGAASACLRGCRNLGDALGLSRALSRALLVSSSLRPMCSTSISRIAIHSFCGLSRVTSRQRVPCIVPFHVSSGCVSSFNFCGSWQLSKLEDFKEPCLMKSFSCPRRACLTATFISPCTGSSNITPEDHPSVECPHHLPPTGPHEQAKHLAHAFWECTV